MKKYTSLLYLLFVLSVPSYSQINLLGAKAHPSATGTEIVKWNVSDTLSMTTYPTPLNGYYLNSSLFDAWNSRYYLTGVTADSAGLLEFNSLSNTQSLLPFRQFSNICEIDMSTGKIYTLNADSTDYFSVNEYDIATGTDSLIGIVYEPNTTGIIVDATGFNSNDGILYYVGYNSNGEHCLFSMYVRSPIFNYTKTTLVTNAYDNFIGVNYDNVNNLLFALSYGFDPSGNPGPPSVIEIDRSSGNVTTRGYLNGIMGFLMGSSAFDQFTGSFLVAGVDSLYNMKMIIFNTATNTWETGYLPDGVSEIVCDNYAYAQWAYGTTSTQSAEKDNLRVYPNPTDHLLFIETENIHWAEKYEIIDIKGMIKLTGTISQQFTEISCKNLPSGMYLLRLTNKTNRLIYRIIKQ
jgi:hypothetical protein